MLILFLKILFSIRVFASPLAEGPTSLGLAGSGRAGLDAPESIFLNPALVGLSSSSAAQFVYVDGKPAPGSSHTEAGVTLIDGSSEDTFSNGGLSYRRLRRDGVNGDLWHMGLGKLVHPRFALGASLYWLQYKARGLDIPDQWNGSLGLLFLITPDLGLAYVLDSPVKVDWAVPVGLREVLRHSIGAYYKLTEISRFRMDLVKQEELNPDDDVELSASLEVMSSDFFQFRLGQAWDWRTDNHWLGVGFGFVGPRLKVTYGLKKPWEGRAALHSVDLRLPF